MHRRLVTALGASLLLLAALLPTATAAQPVAKSGPHQFTKAGNYIVQMRDLPAVAYDGSIKGLAATKPAKGQKIDPNSAVVTKYVGHLNAQARRQAEGRRRDEEALRLHVQLQRLLGPSDGRPGQQAGRGPRRPRRVAVRDAVHRHLVDPDVPGADRSGRPVGPARRLPATPATTSSSASSTRASGRSR